MLKPSIHPSLPLHPSTHPSSIHPSRFHPSSINQFIYPSSIHPSILHSSIICSSIHSSLIHLSILHPHMFVWLLYTCQDSCFRWNLGLNTGLEEVTHSWAKWLSEGWYHPKEQFWKYRGTFWLFHIWLLLAVCGQRLGCQGVLQSLRSSVCAEWYGPLSHPASLELFEPRV